MASTRGCYCSGAGGSAPQLLKQKLRVGFAQALLPVRARPAPQEATTEACEAPVLSEYLCRPSGCPRSHQTAQGCISSGVLVLDLALSRGHSSAGAVPLLGSWTAWGGPSQHPSITVSAQRPRGSYSGVKRGTLQPRAGQGSYPGVKCCTLQPSCTLHSRAPAPTSEMLHPPAQGRSGLLPRSEMLHLPAQGGSGLPPESEMLHLPAQGGSGLPPRSETLYPPAQGGSGQDLARRRVSAVPRVLTLSAAAARPSRLLPCVHGSGLRASPRTMPRALWAGLSLLHWVLFPGLPARDAELSCCVSFWRHWCAGAHPGHSLPCVSWLQSPGLARIILRGSGLSASRQLLCPDSMPSCNVEQVGLHFPVQGFRLLRSGICVKAPVSLCPARAHS